MQKIVYRLICMSHVGMNVVLLRILRSISVIRCFFVRRELVLRTFSYYSIEKFRVYYKMFPSFFEVSHCIIMINLFYKWRFLHENEARMLFNQNGHRQNGVCIQPFRIVFVQIFLKQKKVIKTNTYQCGRGYRLCNTRLNHFPSNGVATDPMAVFLK